MSDESFKVSISILLVFFLLGGFSLGLHDLLQPATHKAGPGITLDTPRRIDTPDKVGPVEKLMRADDSFLKAVCRASNEVIISQQYEIHCLIEIINATNCASEAEKKKADEAKERTHKAVMELDRATQRYGR